MKFPLHGREQGSLRILVLAITFAAVAAVAVALPLHISGHASWLSAALGFLRLKAADDSWMPMLVALDYLSSNADKAHLYEHIFFEKGIKFQYAPTSLAVLLGLPTLFGIPLDKPSLNALNAVLVVATVLATAVLGLVAARQQKLDRRTCAAAAALGVTGTICFHPLLWAYALGQIQVWINAGFAIACVAWLLRRTAWAGVIMGLVVLLKPQFLLFAFWAAWRRQWNFFFAFVATLAFGLILSCLHFGWGAHLAYLDVVSALARTGEGFHANQSVNGLLNRLFETSDSLRWSSNAFPTYHSAVHLGTVAFSILVLILLAIVLPRHAGRASLLEYQLVALAFTLMSPIAWEHHFGILPGMYLAACIAMTTQGPCRNRAPLLALLATSYLLVSTSVPPLIEITAGSPLNLVQSHVLLGALLLLGVLTTLLKREQSAENMRSILAPSKTRPPRGG